MMFESQRVLRIALIAAAAATLAACAGKPAPGPQPQPGPAPSPGPSAPVTQAPMLFPAMMAQFHFLDVRIELGVLAVLGIVFLGLARRALTYMEALSRREGRLTIRGL